MDKQRGWEDNPYGRIGKTGQLVEIFDGYNRPFMLTTVKKAQRLRLTRRMVLVSLRDARKRIFLQKRAEHNLRHPGKWDIAVTGYVPAGESLEGTAIHGLQVFLGVYGARIKTFSSLPYEDADGTRILATFFLAGPCHGTPRLDPEAVSDGMFLTEGELRGLSQTEPDMFTPELIWGARSGWIFA